MEKYIDISYFWGAFPVLLPFLKITFLFVGISALFGFAIGLVIAMMKLSTSHILQKIAQLYTTVLRCTPSIVLLFLVYYGLPALAQVASIDLYNIEAIYFVITAFTLQFGAIMSEVIRSAYLSVDTGQYAAAVSVGLTPFQAYRRIIVPQAVVTAMPNIGNGLISLLQEGALAYTIGFIDVVGKAQLVIASNYHTHALEIYVALAVIYWVLSIAIEQVFGKIERLYQKGSRSVKA